MKTKSSDIRSALILSGKKEFLEHGFEKASLRKICSEANVTTGAVYSQFESKEDLFIAVVQPTLDELNDICESLVNAALKDMKANIDNELRFIRFFYDHRDEFKILFDCSDGTCYAGFKEHLIDDIFVPLYQLCFNHFANTLVDPAVVKVFVKLKFAQFMELAYGGYQFDEIIRLTEIYSKATTDEFAKLCEKVTAT